MTQEIAANWGTVVYKTDPETEKRVLPYLEYWRKTLEKADFLEESISEEKEDETGAAETGTATEQIPLWIIKKSERQAVTTELPLVPPVEIRREIADKRAYILNLLENDIYEPGVITQLQRYIERQLKEENAGNQPKGIQQLLGDIYLECFQNSVAMFVNLLQVVSQIDYALISPAGPIMAIAATRHEDCEVREYGLRCYENWEDKASLKILKKLHFEETWLQNYLNMLIADLEEDD